MKGREYGGQDPNYDFIEGGIRDRDTGEIIPDDEPVFVLRASDVHALRALVPYSHAVDDELNGAVRVRIEDFRTFKQEHPERMRG